MKITLTALGAVLAAFALAGCASQPSDYAVQLNQKDPKWNSPECREIRLKALDFDQHIGQRVGIGIASGLLLGPFGIPIAAAADANQNDRRKQFDREVHIRCSSKPLPDNLKVNPPVKPGAKTSVSPRG